ncbi:sigma-54-dependent transcriptional regulator [Riemerella anatipestifer]|uniref:Response regulator containing CheY-like receiver, AAA-type ATPase, and DNA-binding domains n=1 Tax=Riemerella anatipestifer RA-CH-1 TaxID=1228997 RepID=J9R4F6_RIEAN|nr:sigma-54 dependent transcriptional regulator [Riemerella anatipestifer]ADZ11466.1 Response regulator containing CheY-like receiver, AAA-type ATPase, and DNA-binding domains [Riemerella anatipestifer RA-GD]AFR36769.1 Response regulator containing CheY-like receiver, AAA-type ATPase, and DNA-binding domains [Riemerella anatipestifer RA-CH-1]AGC40992.1 Response regulator containing CheY-like receiver, AAA-type ATPase, and DNA-binding domains [Riemerella anatipestifer RA-CH-2]AIH01571.1 Sigma-54
MQKILIVEDEKAISGLLKNILSEEIKDYEILVADDGLEAYKLIEKDDFSLVISDIKMPKVSGTELLQKALEIKPDTAFVMISAHGDINTAVQCLKQGAYDFIEKPIDLNRLITSVRNTLERKELKTSNQILKKENTQLKKKVNKKYQMIGSSEALKKIQDMIDKVAPSDARVLITGPNGAGKELVAHALHSQSERSKGPMVEVNCAAIPSELIESELFGHMKGSFTGAVKDKSGKFEQANGGTIFLDEIGDMSLVAQAKVLRALQEHKVSPVGSDKEIKIDVRVLAATNKNLQKEIEEGRFREDLYHRLSVIEIQVPALNDRKEDIPLLVEHFAQNIASENGSPVKEFSKEALKALQNYDWTGNIRELRNVVERLIILGENPVSENDISNFVKK